MFFSSCISIQWTKFSNPTPLPFPPNLALPGSWPCQTVHRLATALATCSLSATMHPTSIAHFTATVSIFYAYMEAMMDQRIQTLETIAGAAAKILQQCGRSHHVSSLFTLWSTTSNALWLAERAIFPDLPAETALHLALPPDPRPLAACLDSTFEPYAN